MAAMPTGAFFECAADSREVPDVFVGGEIFGDVLRTEYPGVIRQAAFGMGAGVGVNELPSRWDADGIDIKREIARIFNEVKKMRVATGEFLFAMNAECVIPDHPAAATETKLLGDYFQFGGIFVADGEPESAVGAERAMDAGHPLARPIQIMVVRLTVVVNVVFVADVERRIGERQMHAAGLQLRQQLDAIALMNPIGFQRHDGDLRAR